jgi:hypothetical protein
MGGFPAALLGAKVVSGRKRCCRWLSHCVIGCWGGLRASAGANEPVGGGPHHLVSPSSSPCGRLHPLPFLISSFISLGCSKGTWWGCCHGTRRWVGFLAFSFSFRAVRRARGRAVATERGGRWVFPPPHLVLGLFDGWLGGNGVERGGVWVSRCLVRFLDHYSPPRGACGLHNAPSSMAWAPCYFLPPPLPILGPSRVDGTMVGDDVGKSVLPTSLEEGRGKVGVGSS